jgi:hypothetical protein
VLFLGLITQLQGHFPQMPLGDDVLFHNRQEFRVVRGWVERIRFRLTVYRDGPKEQDFYPGFGANRSA